MEKGEDERGGPMKGESGGGGFEGRVSGVSRRDWIFLESRWRRQMGVRFCCMRWGEESLRTCLKGHSQWSTDFWMRLS